MKLLVLAVAWLAEASEQIMVLCGVACARAMWVLHIFLWHAAAVRVVIAQIGQRTKHAGSRERL